MFRLYIKSPNRIHQKCLASPSTAGLLNTRHQFIYSHQLLRNIQNFPKVQRQNLSLKNLIWRISGREGSNNPDSSSSSHNQLSNVTDSKSPGIPLSLNIDDLNQTKPKKSFLWRFKGKRNGKDYVGLRVAIDAKHAEKTWLSFYFEPLDSVIRASIDSDYKDVWNKYYNASQSSLDSRDVPVMLKGYKNIEKVFFEILDTFAKEIESEISRNLAEKNINNILQREIPVFNEYWGYRINFVFNELLSVRTFCKNIGLDLSSLPKNDTTSPLLARNHFQTILQVLFSSIIKSRDNNSSFNLDELLNISRQKNLLDASDSNSNNISTQSISHNISSLESIQNTSSTLPRAYFNVLYLYGSHFDLNASHLNNLLTACLIFNDLQLTFETLNHFLKLKLDFNSLINNNSTSDSSLKDRKSTSEDDLSSKSFSLLTENLKKATLQNPFISLKVKPTPLTFVLISKISTQLFVSDPKNTGLGLKSLEILRSSYILYRNMCKFDDSFYKDSSTVFSSLDNVLVINPESYGPLGIVPEMEILIGLFTIHSNLGQVPEALNFYESFKVFLSNNYQSISESSQESRASTQEFDVPSTTAHYFNMALKSVCNSDMDWLSKIIFTDLKQYNLTPNSETFSLYFSYLAKLSYSERLQGLREFLIFIDTTYDLHSKKSHQIVIDIISSLSEIQYFSSIDNSRTSLDFNTHSENLLDDKDLGSIEMVVINFYLKFVSHDSFSHQNLKVAINGLVQFICVSDDLKYLNKFHNIILENQRMKSALTIKDSVLIMNAYSRLGKPETSISIFQSILASPDVSNNNKRLKFGLYTAAMLAYFKASQYIQVIEIWNDLSKDSEDLKESLESDEDDMENSSDLSSDFDLKDFHQTTFDILTASYVELNKLKEPLRLLEKMRAAKIQATSFIYATLLKGFGKAKNREGISLVCALANMDRNLAQDSQLVDSIMFPGRPIENYSAMQICKNDEQDLTTIASTNLLGSNYYCELIGAYANCGNFRDSLQTWELMKMYKIKPTSESVSVLIDICGFTERSTFSEERTLQPINSKLDLEFSSRNLVSYIPDMADPNSGKMLNLHLLGTLVDELVTDGGITLTPSHLKSIFEVLVRARLYDEAVEFLEENPLYSSELKISSGEYLEDSIHKFAENLLNLVGEPANNLIEKVKV
ncbi:hypothetical protein AYI68_g305 [Smittium mucronatum]|uniref:Pentatricopeptide repeat-containing protein n=1 Tax=Smittium mucronatum TaxID=133383 RepID=A0A1R0H8Q6_9FUNG|nr:hypothetical protein AYI68_g305 [Smittium mucronatum]